MLDIGQQIKRLRERKRITGKDLARRIGLSQSQMSRLEQGQRRIDTEILARIAGALDVSPACFFGDASAEIEAPSPKRERELTLHRLHVELGKLIRSERRQRHITVDDLARKTGHTKAYVIAVEEGRRNGLDDDFLRKACRMLAIDPFTPLLMQETIIRDLKTRIHQLDIALSREGPRASAPDERGGESRTPILVGDEQVYPAEFDDEGHPVAAVEGYLQLPELASRPTFGVRVCGDEMAAPGGSSFEEGDLVVFSTDRRARSGEFAFVRYGEDHTTFRRIFHDEESIIRLQAAHPEVAPILFTVEKLRSSWPLVAHVKTVDDGG